MRFPLSLTSSMAGYIAKKKITRQKKFPLVLMLEPLHACNLTCTGCGRIREYSQTIKDKLTLEECLASVDEAGTPIVSICGGEPLIYPEIGDLVQQILNRRKHIYLCTNGVFLEKKLDLFKPSNRFFFNVHLDGLEETHDFLVERKGVFRPPLKGSRRQKKLVSWFARTPLSTRKPIWMK
jgi:hopanoid biosynthesis associated radical SAM protein HpnH